MTKEEFIKEVYKRYPGQASVSDWKRLPWDSTSICHVFSPSIEKQQKDTCRSIAIYDRDLGNQKELWLRLDEWVKGESTMTKQEAKRLLYAELLCRGMDPKTVEFERFIGLLPEVIITPPVVLCEDYKRWKENINV